MVKIGILEYKESKLSCVKAFKHVFGGGLKEAKDACEYLVDTPKLHEFPTENDLTGLFKGVHIDIIIKFCIENFKCEIIDQRNDYKLADINPYERIPDAETQEALDWYERRVDFDKRRIDLIGKWMNPQLIACG